MGAFLKKYAVLMVVALMLAGAIYVNIRLNKGTETGAVEEAVWGENSKETAETAIEQDAGTNYFESFRNERDAVRTTEIQYLDEVIAASASDAETLSDAQTQKLALVENMETEFTVESLLKAKGFSDAAVTFHKGSVNVVVDCEELTQEKVAQILDIVKRETGEGADNIKIMNENG
ncbi:MAG: SpoIIIAH-like family protein [Clostridia bacterium]|nr:SpoIIIAH-like family protein [Candidatus Pelethousia sp.]NCB30436.1 SpoIIIAH-like family protein [Clostridia bacterium]